MTADKEKNFDALDWLIKEALASELEEITPPPPEKMWDRIVEGLEKTPPAETPKTRRHARPFFRRPWGKYTAIAACLLLVAGLSSLVLRSDRGGVVADTGVSLDGTAEEEAAPPGNAVEEEGPFPALEAGEQVFRGDDSTDTLSLPWRDAATLDVAYGEAGDLLPVDLSREFAAAGIFPHPRQAFRAGADGDEALYAVYRGVEEAFIVTGRETYPDHAGASRSLEAFSRAGSGAKSRSIGDAAAYLVEFASGETGFAWVEGNTMFVVFSNLEKDWMEDILSSLSPR